MDYTKYVLKDKEKLTSLLEGKDKIFIISCNKCFKEFKTAEEPELAEFKELALAQGKTVTGTESLDFLCNSIQTKQKLDGKIPEGTENIIVISCGLGVQTIAEMEGLSVYTATDSLNYIGFHGMALTKKTCDACNQCYLNITGGICPITDCTKSLINGQCGGAKNGKCEIDPAKDCAWEKIYRRLEKQGRNPEFVAQPIQLRDYSKVNFQVVHDYVNSVRDKRLDGYYGGIHPLEKKELTEHMAPVAFPAPAEVVIPMSQHVGKPATPIVKVGDYVKVGQKIGELAGFISCNIHSSVSGTVTAVEDRPGSRGPVLSVVIKNDYKEVLDDSVKPAKPLEELTPQEIVDIVKEKGIAGMGGATFPTYVKLMPGKPIDVVLINGSECEPLITVDHRALLAYADDVIYGLKAIMKAVDAPKGIIVVEDNKPDAIANLKEKLEGCENIEVLQARTKYPQGAEKMLIKRATGRKVPSGGLPADVGVVVSNVGSAKAIADAIKTGMPLVERLVTVSGEKIAHPGNYLVKIGTDVEEVIDYCGGITGDNVTVKMGGPMMGVVLKELGVPVNKGTNGIIALETDHTVPQECIKCGRCVDVCPMELRPLQFYKNSENPDGQTYKDLGVMDCMECGCCEFICSSKIKLLDCIRAGKSAVRGMK